MMHKVDEDERKLKKWRTKGCCRRWREATVVGGRDHAEKSRKKNYSNCWGTSSAHLTAIQPIHILANTMDTQLFLSSSSSSSQTLLLRLLLLSPAIFAFTYSSSTPKILLVILQRTYLHNEIVRPKEATITTNKRETAKKIKINMYTGYNNAKKKVLAIQKTRTSYKQAKWSHTKYDSLATGTHYTHFCDSHMHTLAHPQWHTKHKYPNE